jgi:hypothetical protein
MFVVDVIGGLFHPGPATLLGSAYRYGPSGYFYDQENAAIRIQPGSH